MKLFTWALHCFTLLVTMIKLFCVDIVESKKNLNENLINFIKCHFVSLIFFYILALISKMPKKV